MRGQDRPHVVVEDLVRHPAETMVRPFLATEQRLKPIVVDKIHLGPNFGRA